MMEAVTSETSTSKRLHGNISQKTLIFKIVLYYELIVDCMTVNTVDGYGLIEGF
jgi:hypothetical protein